MNQNTDHHRPWLARFADQPSRQLVAAACLLALVIVALFLRGQTEAYDERVTRAERDTRNAAILLAQHAARTFASAEESLRAVGRLRQDAARGIYRSRESIYVHLKTLHGGSPLMTEIGWFDVYGVRAATSLQLDPPNINVADQAFFKVQREGSAGQSLHVGVPQTLVPGHGWQIPLSVRLENLDGSFAGVAAGTIDPDEFATVYRSLELGPGHRTMLLRRDGIVLAHVPEGDGLLGRTLPDGAIAQARFERDDSASYRDHGGVDGSARIGSFAVVPRTQGQLLVDVSVPRDVALAEFWRDFVADSMLAGVGLIVLVVGTGIIVMGLRRRERLQTELAAAIDAAKLSEQEAQVARGAAEAANRAKSEFLARMSHELRTPLNAVIGFAQMLELDVSRTLTQRQLEYSRHVREAGEHLLSLVNEVLDLSGVESGRLSLSLEPVMVGDSLRGIFDIMGSVAAKANIDLRLEPIADMPPVRGDMQRLKQVLINLVGNAIKYNRPNGCVMLSARQIDGARVRLAVKDTGPGIAAERRQELFEPFQRLGAEYTAVEGTGLGLALAKRIAHAMGGTIDYETELGVGSTFWVDMPIDPTAGSAAHEVNSPQRPSMHEASLRAFKLLHVEDNIVNMRLMEHVIGTLLSNVTIVAAPTPERGLQLAASERPDVIVLDINLPGMSGYEVLARLKAMPETREIPVLALTAAALPRDVERGTAAGFFRYLTKPFDVKKLMAALDDALRSRQPPCGGAAYIGVAKADAAD